MFCFITKANYILAGGFIRQADGLWTGTNTQKTVTNRNPVHTAWILDAICNTHLTNIIAVWFSVAARRVPPLEPAYSLYSTDSEDQVKKHTWSSVKNQNQWHFFTLTFASRWQQYTRDWTDVLLYSMEYFKLNKQVLYLQNQT